MGKPSAPSPPSAISLLLPHPQPLEGKRRECRGNKGEIEAAVPLGEGRHITLMVSFNISLTPIPLACRAPPTHPPTPPLPLLALFPCSQPQPPNPPPLPPRPLLPPPTPPGSAPRGPVCFPARGTGGGTLMRCSGHREMRHNLPARGPGEIAVFTF